MNATPRRAVRTQFSINSTDEWAAWVRGLTRKQGVCFSDLINLALWQVAEECGYDDPPPRTRIRCKDELYLRAEGRLK